MRFQIAEQRLTIGDLRTFQSPQADLQSASQVQLGTQITWDKDLSTVTRSVFLMVAAVSVGRRALEGKPVTFTTGTIERPVDTGSFVETL